jgi:hypothetical protein
MTQVAACLVVCENRWIVGASCTNRNGLYATFDIAYWGDCWDEGQITTAILTVVRSQPPGHGLFMSEEDWEEEVSAHLKCKSMSRVYRNGCMFLFDQTAGGDLRCIPYRTQGRHAFFGGPEDPPIFCKPDPESLKTVLRQFYEQMKPRPTV